MLHRLPVIVSGLAMLTAFLWAPHVHLHRDNGVRHAHLAPHQHNDHHDGPVHEPDPQDDQVILDADAFLSTVALRIVPPTPAPAPETPPSEIPVVRIGLMDADQPRVHGPPLRDLTGPRPPPASTLAF